eukprot:scaffold124507_cov36-Phaeocystis_antarctica.AAC.2
MLPAAATNPPTTTTLPHLTCAHIWESGPLLHRRWAIHLHREPTGRRWWDPHLSIPNMTIALPPLQPGSKPPPKPHPHQMVSISLDRD